MPEFPDPARYRAPSTSVPASDDITAAAALLAGARNPLILLGRLSRDPRDWARRVALAERLKARVLTDIKVGAVFPTDHELHAAKPGHFLDETGARHIREADVIAAFDWVDLAGTLKQGGGAAGAKVINVALDHHLHNGWSMDHQALPPADLYLSGDPDLTLHLIADELGVGAGSEPDTLPALPALNLEKQARELDVVSLAAAIGEVLRDEIVSLVRLPLGWAGESWHFRHPLDYLGSDGGAGIGSGPGMLVGAALAFKGSERLPVAVLGDGDTMMGVSALWTAAHYKLPFLAIVSNNRSFYNDEIHQERVARTRDRPVENKWIGQRIGDPDIDIAAIARAQGLVGIGPVTTTADLVKAVREGVSAAKAGASVVIDARVKPGYNPTMAAGMTREGSKTAGD